MSAGINLRIASIDCLVGDADAGSELLKWTWAVSVPMHYISSCCMFLLCCSNSGILALLVNILQILVLPQKSLGQRTVL